MPTVSVIIPNYNYAHYLEQRIDSILSQSYQDFELIILDDFSRDDSRKIIESFRGHPRITHIVYNDKNSGGPFKQWEKGIALAKGKFIWIAEGDDWCEQNLLEELVYGLKKDPDCVISYCQSYCINESNTISWISQHPHLSETVEGDVFIKKYLLMNNSIFNASMVLWKKEFYEKISGEFLNYKFCGDWLFWTELARHGNVHISGKVLNYFRKHENDVSGRATKNGLEIIETLSILDTMHTRQIINTQEYNKALKRTFRNYLNNRSNFDPATSQMIKRSFKNSSLSGTDYKKMIISGIWRGLMQKLKP